MFYKYILYNNLNRQTLLRHFKDFDRFIVRDLLEKQQFSTRCQQSRPYHGVTSKFLEKTTNVFTIRRIFCTKSPPIKKNDRFWPSIRRQHQESRREIRRLFTLAKNEKWYLIGAIGCLCVSSSVTLGVPHAIGKIMDMIVLDNFPKEKLHGFCIILFGIFIAGSLANFGRIYLMNSASKLPPNP